MLLRYPGGKSKAINILSQYIPKDVTTLASPFFGGGSFELWLAKRGVRVYGYDHFDLLVNFWQCVLENNTRVYEQLLAFPDSISPNAFQYLQDVINYYDCRFEQAAAFYILNRCSFSGSVLKSGMSKGHPRYNHTAIQKVKNFQISNLSVDKVDYKDSILQHKHDFLYLDPPYYLTRNYYGHTEVKYFNHNLLRELLDTHDNWMLSYNDCDEIRKLYDGFKIVDLSWQYGMGKDKKGKEILILNGK